MKRNMKHTISLLSIVFIFVCVESDKPCVGRKYNHESIVCVCNSTYCDDISEIKIQPQGHFVAYYSNLEGARFVRTEGQMIDSEVVDPDELTVEFDILQSNWKQGEDGHNVDKPLLWKKIIEKKKQKLQEKNTITINKSQGYQKIFGFGGAFTDAAGINYMKLSAGAQKNFIMSYFSKNGIEYNLGRLPIAGTDFSTYPYAYNMYPENDTKLTNFSLTMEDYEYKIPLIHEAMKVMNDELLLVASAWSPPVWMKTNGQFGGFSRLKPEYYQTWADYHLKFLEEYDKNDINIWAMTTGNEPSLGTVPVYRFNSLGWSPERQATYVAENLGPTIKNSKFFNVSFLVLDDQRIELPWWINLIMKNKIAENYIDGIATHWYLDDFTPISLVSITHKLHPNKFFLSTETCVGYNFWDFEKVELGSWTRGEKYITSIIEYLNNWYTGWIDWNLALDRQGGPNWIRNFVDSPIIVMPEDEFLKQPLFYAMGHFSKFIPRGSVRVDTGKIGGGIQGVALQRPDGGTTVVFYNPHDTGRKVTIKEEGKGAIILDVMPRTVYSVVYW